MSWYDTARWGRLRISQLRREPLCKYCLAQGRVTEAKVADHVIPHKGDRELFFCGELQSLCVQHHNGTKRSEEAGKISVVIGSDGFPIEGGLPADLIAWQTMKIKKMKPRGA